MPAAARRKRRAQRLKLLGQFVREHSWGVMITVLIVMTIWQPWSTQSTQAS